mmetsp:Transcript_7803/g.24493  ORF Transcript_7803/g.24493 Transcript_7803/m.24493 type:complete len:221 (-) Transcript_7803:150-812(-)
MARRATAGSRTLELSIASWTRRIASATVTCSVAAGGVKGEPPPARDMSPCSWPMSRSIISSGRAPSPSGWSVSGIRNANSTSSMSPLKMRRCSCCCVSEDCPWPRKLSTSQRAAWSRSESRRSSANCLRSISSALLMRSLIMESVSRPTMPSSVYDVASTLTNGALQRAASRLASSVFPLPVGPRIRMFIGCISRRSSSERHIRLQRLLSANATERFASS